MMSTPRSCDHEVYMCHVQPPLLVHRVNQSYHTLRLTRQWETAATKWVLFC